MPFDSYSVPRARLCLIENSRNVEIGGLTFQDSQFWNLHLYNCQSVTVQNAHFLVPDDYHQAPSSDGIDVDSCQNVTIRGCLFSVTDDCVCLKGNRYDGLKQEPPSPLVENVLVEGCAFLRGHGALTLGTEAQTIRDVEIKNCVVRGEMPMLRLKLRPDTPNQSYSNIRVRGIQLDGTEGEIVRVSPHHGTKVPTPPTPISNITGIEIENISGRFGSFGTLSAGTTATVSDVAFRNLHVTLTGDSILNTEGVANVTFENVVVRKPGDSNAL
jgi:alpha-L-rhamnosidase